MNCRLRLLCACFICISLHGAAGLPPSNGFEVHIDLLGKAPGAHVLGIVYRLTALSVGLGIAAGLALTLDLQKVLERWAEGSSRDPLVVLIAALLLGAVALAACSLPAPRAARWIRRWRFVTN